MGLWPHSLGVVRPGWEPVWPGLRAFTVAVALGQDRASPVPHRWVATPALGIRALKIHTNSP